MNTKKMFVMSLFVVGLLAGCTEVDYVDFELFEPKTVEEYGQELTEQVEQMVDAKDLPELDEATRATTEQNILRVLQDANDMAYVSFDKDNLEYIYLPTDADLVRDINAIAEGTLDMEVWNLMIDEFIAMSEGLQEALGPGYRIVLLNPIRSDLMLLIIMDGKVYYDAFNE